MAPPAPEIAAALRRLPGFGDLEAEDLASLTEGASPLRAAPGQTLMRRGDPGGNLMVLLEGRLRVSTVSAEGRPLAFRLVEPVECVGEIGCLDGQPRTADVAVLAPSRLLVLPRGA
ncbi:MAG: cyclic nucleotide-binding domain-containing protein, partial [Acetobacteraceae bacterium]|nr:cyclic nucleotide-binding domain-containing protein [Acetobacteraceae bacterium]